MKIEELISLLQNHSGPSLILKDCDIGADGAKVIAEFPKGQ